jgi:hypothetical protein
VCGAPRFVTLCVFLPSFKPLNASASSIIALLSALPPPLRFYCPPPAPVENIKCTVNPSKLVYTDGEQFPYGSFHSDVCSCTASPYGIRFGEDIVYQGV